MKIKLDNEWVTKLQSQPETSMGAQDVTVKMSDGQEYQGLVFNCQHLFLVGEIDPTKIIDIKVLEANVNPETIMPSKL